MKAFKNVESAAAPFLPPNIDTDQILPARFLHKPRSGGFGQYLFHDLRFDVNGAERPEFALNQPHHRDARVVVANVNFGCGSSRENAVWALSDYGFEVVIAPSFGDIFHTNCVKNGLLPVRLPDAVVADLLTRIFETPDSGDPGGSRSPDGHAAGRNNTFLRNRPIRQILPDQWLRRTRLHLVPSRRDCRF